jgi:hypothetical protein
VCVCVCVRVRVCVWSLPQEDSQGKPGVPGMASKGEKGEEGKPGAGSTTTTDSCVGVRPEGSAGSFKFYPCTQELESCPAAVE